MPGVFQLLPGDASGDTADNFMIKIENNSTNLFENARIQVNEVTYDENRDFFIIRDFIMLGQVSNYANYKVVNYLLKDQDASLIFTKQNVKIGSVATSMGDELEDYCIKGRIKMVKQLSTKYLIMLCDETGEILIMCGGEAGSYLDDEVGQIYSYTFCQEDVHTFDQNTRRLYSATSNQFYLKCSSVDVIDLKLQKAATQDDHMEEMNSLKTVSPSEALKCSTQYVVLSIKGFFNFNFVLEKCGSNKLRRKISITQDLKYRGQAAKRNVLILFYHDIEGLWNLQNGEEKIFTRLRSFREDEKDDMIFVSTWATKIEDVNSST
jgi:hypothetical protein